MNINLIKQLWGKFKAKKYRDAFVASHLSTNIASQIFVMREARGWKQQELAEETGMAQARISVMENPGYENFSLATLKRLASAFDVALVVRFVPFGELAQWITQISPSVLAPPQFTKDPLHQIMKNPVVESSWENESRKGPTQQQDQTAWISNLSSGGSGSLSSVKPGLWRSENDRQRGPLNTGYMRYRQ